MKEDLVNTLRELMAGNPERKRAYDTLEKFIREGEVARVCGEQLYCRKVSFKTDSDANYREQSTPPPDYEKMSDEELWSYIYGDYIMKGEISKLCAFGATKVETY
jgi:hypothetical protein